MGGSGGRFDAADDSRVLPNGARGGTGARQRSAGPGQGRPRQRHPAKLTGYSQPCKCRRGKPIGGTGGSRMNSGFYGPEGFGSSPFDDFLARIYGAGAESARPQRVDITRLMSARARELLGAAAAKAAELGGTDLDTVHLLGAAATLDPTRQLLSRAGADPDELARAIEAQERRGESRAEPPQLTPGAKRALLDAHQISRSLGSTYIWPEHILFALAINSDSSAGRMLSNARVTPEALQAALAGQPFPPGQGGPSGPGGRAATPTLDQFGRDLTAMAREGQIDPVIGRDSEIEQTVEVLSRRGKNNPVLIGRGRAGASDE